MLKRREQIELNCFKVKGYNTCSKSEGMHECSLLDILNNNCVE